MLSARAYGLIGDHLPKKLKLTGGGGLSLLLVHSLTVPQILLAHEQDESRGGQDFAPTLCPKGHKHRGTGSHLEGDTQNSHHGRREE